MIPKELCIYVDYTDKSNTRISVSNYFNQIQFTDSYDLNVIDFYDAIRRTISNYKSILLQQSQELSSLKHSKSNTNALLFPVKNA